MTVSRCAALTLVAAWVLALPSVALSAPTPPSAPSEYVEVVPTAGGGAAAGARPPSSSGAAGSRSTVAAAADAIGSGDEWLVGLGAVLAATTLSLAAGTALRRRRAQEPKG
jgi:hypothetical protein